MMFMGHPPIMDRTEGSTAQTVGQCEEIHISRAEADWMRIPRLNIQIKVINTIINIID